MVSKERVKKIIKIEILLVVLALMAGLVYYFTSNYIHKKIADLKSTTGSQQNSSQKNNNSSPQNNQKSGTTSTNQSSTPNSNGSGAGNNQNGGNTGGSTTSGGTKTSTGVIVPEGATLNTPPIPPLPSPRK